MTTDEQALFSYSESGDPAAFRCLVERYSGFVYSVCLRITGNRHDAEDLCQECFLELARKAGSLHTSVVGWLHASATNRAINLLRSRKRRTARELAVAAENESPSPIEDFATLQPLIDEALADLDDDLRLPLIRHYLNGETQESVARSMNVDQATISRRLQRGVDDLRARMKRMGILTTVAALSSLLGQSSAQAASPSLMGSLTKISLAGIGSAASKPAFGLLKPVLASAGAAAANILVFLFAGGWLGTILLLVEIALLIRRPAWVVDVLSTCGLDAIVNHQLAPFRKWTWETPPADWKQWLAAWSVAAFMFWMNGFLMFARTNSPLGLVMMWFVGAAGFTFLVLRLARRVWVHRHCTTPLPEDPHTIAVKYSWATIGRSAGVLLIGSLWLTVMPASSWPTPWYRYFMYAAMAACAIDMLLRIRQRLFVLNDEQLERINMSRATKSVTPESARKHATVSLGILLLAVAPLLAGAACQPPLMPRQRITNPRSFTYTRDGGIRVTDNRDRSQTIHRLTGPTSMVTSSSLALVLAVFAVWHVARVQASLSPRMRVGVVAPGLTAVIIALGLIVYGVAHRGSGL